MNKGNKKVLSRKQHLDLFKVLKARFEKNMDRHNGLNWDNIQVKLDNDNEKLWSLSEMERTGGEPDVIRYDKKTDEYIFYDCSTESPIGRSGCCYDHVFVYHNGAESYYSTRGFRGLLRV